MAGELVGEAWVAIHARDGGMSGEIREIAKDAAEELDKGLDKEVDKVVKGRAAKDKGIVARLLAADDPQSIRRALDRWKTPEAIKSRIEDMILELEDDSLLEPFVRDMDAAMQRVYRHMEEMDEERIRKLRDGPLH